jgi:hypothetical protein
VRQYGSSFALTFTLPSRSADREPLTERPGIEIYRAALSPGAAPDRKTTWRLAYSVPPEQVDTYLKAGQVEFRDPLAAEDLARPDGSSVAYKVRTRAAKARASEDSNIVAVRIYPPPEAPRDLRVEVTESSLVLNWTGTALAPGDSSRAYRVYRGELEAGQANPLQDLSKAKLKTPQELQGSSPSTEYHDSHFEFGSAYVYTVRSVAQFGTDFVESADSAPAIVTPRDVFPPAAPTGLEISVIPATPQAPTSNCHGP